MSIYFATENPDTLLKKFKGKIEQSDQKGKIDTWEQYDGGFRHTAKDAKDFGLFQAKTMTDMNGQKWLCFDMTKITEVNGRYAYAYFHGHLLQAFMFHLSEYFTRAKYRNTVSPKKPAAKTPAATKPA